MLLLLSGFFSLHNLFSSFFSNQLNWLPWLLILRCICLLLCIINRQLFHVLRNSDIEITMKGDESPLKFFFSLNVSRSSSYRCGKITTKQLQTFTRRFADNLLSDEWMDNNTTSGGRKEVGKPFSSLPSLLLMFVAGAKK